MAMNVTPDMHDVGLGGREHMLSDLDATGGKYDSRTVVVGITPGQPDRVVETAVRWAEMGVIHNIAFVFVDPTLIEVDGHEEPLDSDSLDEQQFRDGAELAQRMTQIIKAHGVHATFRRLGGDPAKRLATEARRLGAAAIIVGTRERGPMAAINEWIRGSVSVRLEHAQNVPVIVIPLGDHTDAGHPIRPRDTSDDAMLDDPDTTTGPGTRPALDHAVNRDAGYEQQGGRQE